MKRTMLAPNFYISGDGDQEGAATEEEKARAHAEALRRELAGLEARIALLDDEIKRLKGTRREDAVETRDELVRTAQFIIAELDEKPGRRKR